MGLRAEKTTWNDNMENELKFFIEFIPNLPALAPFQPNQDIFILTDASEIGIGAQIFQLGDNTTHISDFVQSKQHKKYNGHIQRVVQ